MPQQNHLVLKKTLQQTSNGSPNFTPYLMPSSKSSQSIITVTMFIYIYSLIIYMTTPLQSNHHVCRDLISPLEPRDNCPFLYFCQPFIPKTLVLGPSLDSGWKNGNVSDHPFKCYFNSITCSVFYSPAETFIFLLTQKLRLTVL